MTNKPRRKNDILLKSAFEEAFPDLLRFFYPQADRVFDLDKDLSNYSGWEKDNKQFNSNI